MSPKYDPGKVSITWNGIKMDGTCEKVTSEFEPALPDEGGSYLGGSINIEELSGYLGTVRIPPRMSDARLAGIKQHLPNRRRSGKVGLSVAEELLAEVERLREAAAGAETLIRGYHTDGAYLGHARQFTLTHEGAAMLVRKLVEGERARCVAIIRAEAEESYFTGSSRGDVLRQIADCLATPGSKCRLTENARYAAMDAEPEGDDE